jgi:hypothetical protein
MSSCPVTIVEVHDDLTGVQSVYSTPQTAEEALQNFGPAASAAEHLVEVEYFQSPLQVSIQHSTDRIVIHYHAAPGDEPAALEALRSLAGEKGDA